MADRRKLTPEIVDALIPPIRGEKWIADADLKGFGIRLWANAKGDGFSYAIRIRDHRGIIRRENFSVWADWSASRKMRALLQQDIWEFEWSLFLDDARGWAKSRIRELKGKRSIAECRECRRRKLSDAFQAMSLEAMAERALRKMERQKRKEEYIDQIRKLFWRISEENRSRTLMKVGIRKLAAEIADPALPIMQSRALQAFVGQIYSSFSRWHGPAGKVSDAITRRISTLRSKQGVPYPGILEISEEDLSRFFSLLAAEKKRWREALAIRLYFETGAKMRRILRIRWSEILDDRWYPYSPDERDYWFMGIERLEKPALEVLSLARSRLLEEKRVSRYIFPRIDASVDEPIANVRRYWLRISNAMGWDGLPLSHVVLRHKERNTPSYLHMYRYLFVPMMKRALEPDIVSKLSNLQKI